MIVDRLVIFNHLATDNCAICGIKLKSNDAGTLLVNDFGDEIRVCINCMDKDKKILNLDKLVARLKRNEY